MLKPVYEERIKRLRTSQHYFDFIANNDTNYLKESSWNKTQNSDHPLHYSNMDADLDQKKKKLQKLQHELDDKYFESMIARKEDAIEEYCII